MKIEIKDSGLIAISGKHSAENAITREDESIFVEACTADISSTLKLVEDKGALKAIVETAPHDCCGDYM